MDKFNKKLIFFSIKLVGVLCIAFVIVVFNPKYAHYFLLAMSLVFFTLGLNLLFQYKLRLSWEEKKGILKSIQECEEEVAISEYTRIKYFYPVVEYEYTINGNKHIGNTVSFEKENVWVPEVDSWGNPTPSELKWWLSMKAGDELPVYVNPKNENQAVLVKSVAKSRWSHCLVLLLVGGIIGLIWLFFVMSGR